MAKLVTPPNGGLLLSSSGTYDSVEVGDSSYLAADGSGVVVTILGAATIDAGGGSVGAEDGASIRLLGPALSLDGGAFQAFLKGDGSTLEVASGNFFVDEIVAAHLAGDVLATNATVIVDSSNVTLGVLGFYKGDVFKFSSPAVSLKYAGGYTSESIVYVSGNLSVTEADGSLVTISLYVDSNRYSGSFLPNYQPGNFVIVNGAVSYQVVVPPVVPVISGTFGGQAIREGVGQAAFAKAVVTDGNAGATDTAVVQLSTVSGVLTDPNAAADGSSFNAATGTYSVSGTAAAVTQALEGLVFTPKAYSLTPASGFSTTLKLTVTSSAGTSSTPTVATDSATVVSTFGALVPNNFSPGGSVGATSGLIVQHASGAALLYSSTGQAVVSLGNAGASWHIVATGDFDGDGNADLLLQNDSGALVDYLMNGTSIASGHSLGNPGSNWHVRGTGDFNGDGRSDLVVQSDAGSMVVLETDGSRLVAGVSLGSLPGGWAVEGVGDFNGDGRPDLLVQGPDGTLVVYLVNGGVITAGGVVGNPGAGYSVGGVGNYNGDSKADILLHNDDGVNVVWDVADTTLVGSAFVGNSGSGSVAVGGLDLDGDGRSDLVTQDAGTAVISGSTIGGAPGSGQSVVTGSGVLAGPGSGWLVVGSNPMTFLDGTTLYGADVRGGGNLVLSGTPGADEFVLTAVGDGVHVVQGFDPAQDLVALSASQFPSYAAVQADEQVYQGGTFLGLSATAAIVIAGVLPGQLGAGNFVLR